VTQPQRQRITQITRDRIVELAFKNLTAPQIRDLIAKEVDAQGGNYLPGFSLEVPELRTVQRIVQTVRDGDYSDQEIWSMGVNQDSLDAALVLDTLGEVLVGTEGRVKGFSNEQAKWLNRIRESTEGLSGWGAWILYKLSVEGNDYDSSGLDVLLGLKPWMDERRASELQKLIDSGSISAPSCWSFIKTRSKLMKNGIFGGNGGNHSER